MKKLISVVILLMLVIPNLALASWWNPASWFNSWSFSVKSDDKTLIFEKRVAELEDKLNGSAATDVSSKKALPSLKGLGVVTTSPATIDASLPLKFSGALVELFTMAKSNMEFARKSINEISQSTKERRDFLVKMNSTNDIYFNQLIEVDTNSIKKNEGYTKAFDNGIYFIDSFLPTIEKYKNDILSDNREYDISTYNTFLAFYFEGYKKIQKSLDDVWDNFISSYDNASQTRNSIIIMMKEARNVSNQVNYTRVLSSSYIPSVPAIPALPLQKTINCTMGQMSGARAYYTVSCY